MLNINSIEKSFVTELGTVKKVFRGLNLQVEKGDFISIIGSNGAGKSTLLDTITGNVVVDSGSIDIDGRDITKLPKYKRGSFISKVYQNPSMGTAPSMTVFENLSMADNKGKRFGFTMGLNKKRKEYYRELLKELDLGIENQMDTEVGSLSGGQRQCLALIMATLNKPEILLLDEHTAALDPKTSKIIMDKTKEIVEKNELVKKISEKKEIVWINNKQVKYSEYEKNLPITDEQIKEAEDRLIRFAPFIKKAFPETEITNGIIESPLEPIFNMQKELEKKYNTKIPGKLYLKMDSHLPVAGSIKARGGVYEVLKHAEDLAIAAGMLSKNDDYSILTEEKFKKFFSGYKVQVGSTGNLGLSIGITSAALGFEVIVHMSADAKQWKKDMLRSKGVKVIEYADDYGKAVEEGRKNSDADPKSYFVDDEKSLNLFLGYTIAALRLKKQFDEKGIVIDEEHPLIVYIPCGVGGAPGGVAYGLKRIFKDNVYVFFIEPTLAPCMVLGLATGLHEKISIRDVGIYGITHADGLAVARPSGLVSELMDSLLSGEFTLDDYKLYDYLRCLNQTENKKIEPSSCAAFEGPVELLKNLESKEYIEKRIGKNIENSYQICWATGGRMVPKEDMDKFLTTYLK